MTAAIGIERVKTWTRPVTRRAAPGPNQGPEVIRRRIPVNRLQALISLVGFVAVWWAVTATRLINPLYLPSPGAVWNAFIKANTCNPIAAGSTRIVCGVQQYFLWQHLLMSLERIGVGLGFAIVAGVLVGFLLSSVVWLSRVVMPYINFVRALPPLGYIGLLIVWFGIGDTTKIWLLFLAAFPPIVLATIDGIKGVSKDRINSALSLGSSRLQLLSLVVLPSALPSVLNGIRLAVGFAWTTVVAAELNNGIPGIGALAYLSGTEMNTPLTIACIIVIGIAALVLDGILQLVIHALTPWVGKE
ncbi:taurine ABC transporter permease [Bifidobacterium callitrichos]|uniref:Taurine ABC transporter permease n=1 Tax=Bifidobacterium callitrichos TaxID=762209 RepID=A0A2T3G9B2_9BIFI|nr:ABC transporter permease [Bifidobacterium callitrichos]PST46053.1 taurine ABC transporter permease [Bifidobacterium callitrichos]